MTKPIVFVVPAYGESAFLCDCLDSLKRQSIVVNVVIATSTPNDFLKATASRYGWPIRINPQGGSIASDWNFALKQGGNGLTVLAHQDDIYDADFSKRALEFFAINSSCSIAFTDSNELIDDQLVSNSARESVKKLLRKFAFGRQSIIDSPSRFRRLLGWGCSISCPSVIFNLAKLGPFEFTNEFTLNLDWDAWSRLAQSGYVFGYIRGDLLTHRIHSGAETQKGLVDNRRQQEDLILFSRYWPPGIAKMLLMIYNLGY